VQSHGYEHRFLAELGPEGLARDLERTEQALVAAGAPRPTAFRASTFTLTRATWWAFDVLAERGYRWDSSVHPIRHPDYGVPGFEPGVSRVRAPSGRGELVEFPVSTWPFAGRNLPVGGGGWLRLLPGAVLERAFLDLERRGRPTALYLHPWELDPEQPRQPVGGLKRVRHYLNLDRALPRLERLARRLRFVPMGELLEAHGHL
jgi:polysaccharide deacetylase family protein (PEP-CTERM system associated)